MAEAIDLEQPLLDVGMNSMQLTLLVSILRAEAGSKFSIGDLLTLPVIRCLFCWLSRFEYFSDNTIQHNEHFKNAGRPFGIRKKCHAHIEQQLGKSLSFHAIAHTVTLFCKGVRNIFF
jgi:hypothetical protein